MNNKWKWQVIQYLNGCKKVIVPFKGYGNALKEQKRIEWDFKKYEHLGLLEDDVLETIIEPTQLGGHSYIKKHTYREFKDMIGG